MMKIIFALSITVTFGLRAQAQTSNSLASGGNSTNSTAMIGAAVNTAVAGFMGYQCATQPPPSKVMYCGFALLAATTALNDLAGAKNGKAVTAATTDTSTAGSGIAPGTSTADGGTADKLAAQDQAVIQAAAGKGVTLSGDGKSVNLPNGTSVAASQFGSDANMKNMGLDDDAIAQLKADASAVAAKAKSQYDVAAMPTSDGGGGALNRGSNGDSDEGDSKLKSLLSQLGKNARKPASMSGLSKKLGNTGENIGVAGDDIFQMITRQYQRKDSQNSFIKTP